MSLTPMKSLSSENVASHRSRCLNASLTYMIDNGLGKIRLNPGIWLPMEAAVLNLPRIYQSWSEMVALDRPDLGLSRMIPVL